MASNSKRATNYNKKRTSYVYGNTVRRVEVAEPFSNVPKTFEELEEERREKRKQQKRIRRANRNNFLYTVAVSAIVAGIFTICYQYLNLQSSVKNAATEVANLEQQLTELTAENDEAEIEINAGIDYDAIYNTAVNELGMTYPNKSQVVTYSGGESEYVKQYQDIPSDK